MDKKKWLYLVCLAEIAFLIILAGAFSTIWAGALSGRIGRAKTVMVIMLCSASLLFLI